MAFPAQHFLLAWQGILPGGDIFSGGFRLSPEFTLASQESAQSACDDYAAVLASWWSAAGNPMVSARATLATVKLNRIGTNGKYVEAYTIRKDFEGTLPKGAVGSSLPNQVAWVATLETGRTRGLAHRGRIFFPVPAAGIGLDGYVAAADATNAANRVAALINSVNGVRPSAKVHVYSAGSEKTGAPGVHRPVTGVSVGRVLDTMRTRRNALNEQRMLNTTPVTP
jgi:hypothetical protein